MVSFLHASGIMRRQTAGGRTDKRICFSRLIVGRVLVALPVMAYSVGLKRLFRHEEHDSKPQKRAKVLEYEQEASGYASGVLSEKLARAKIFTSKLGTRLKTIKTERDAAEARYGELEQEFEEFKYILLARKKEL